MGLKAQNLRFSIAFLVAGLDPSLAMDQHRRPQPSGISKKARNSKISLRSLRSRPSGSLRNTRTGFAMSVSPWAQELFNMLRGSNSNIHRWLLSGHPSTVTNKFTKACRSLLGEAVPWRIGVQGKTLVQFLYRFQQGQLMIVTLCHINTT